MLKPRQRSGFAVHKNKETNELHFASNCKKNILFPCQSTLFLLIDAVLMFRPLLEEKIIILYSQLIGY